MSFYITKKAIILPALIFSVIPFYTAKKILLSNTTLRTANASHQTASIDTISYNNRMKHLANGDKTGRWPPADVIPLEGALLPFNRIVAYYGNFYSTQMGILGQYPIDKVLAKLNSEVQLWRNADSLTPVIPAIHYIAVTAQGRAGKDGTYRLRMPSIEIDKAIAAAKQVNGIVFLDVQVGLGKLQSELPALKKYLVLPQVHLGIDAEYAMKNGRPPGTCLGTFDATDINFASGYLAQLVNENNLPPKILVVHRFVNSMLTNYKNINRCSQVQIVINMDGWGPSQKKKDSYYQAVFKEPVQFTGFKLFYKNDAQKGSKLMSPAEILKLVPQPIYIQYQ